MKEIQKASLYVTCEDITREELGDSAKYISVKSTDRDGGKIKPEISLNSDKINKDMALAGYNMIVTSETDMEPDDIYRTYHGLWKIEESLRITKSFLDAGPVYVQKRETIYGHFLICYLTLFLLRILEIKCFGNTVSAYDIITFIRDFRVAKKESSTYINLSRNRAANEKMKKATGLVNLDALYLSECEIENLFNFALPI